MQWFYFISARTLIIRWLYIVLTNHLNKQMHLYSKRNRSIYFHHLAARCPIFFSLPLVPQDCVVATTENRGKWKAKWMKEGILSVTDSSRRHGIGRDESLAGCQRWKWKHISSFCSPTAGSTNSGEISLVSTLLFSLPSLLIPERVSTVSPFSPRFCPRARI